MLVYQRFLIVTAAAWFAMLAANAFSQSFNNGDFEAGTTSNWEVFNPANLELEWGITEEPGNVHSGRYAGVVSALSGTTESVRLINTLSLEGVPKNSLLRVTAWIKLDGLTFYSEHLGVSPVVLTMDAQGAVQSYGHTAGIYHGDFPYMPMDFLIEAPSKAATLQFQLFLGGGLAGGELYLDDVTFEVLSEAGPASTEGTLDARLKRDAGGTPRIMIDGKAETPAIFFGNSFGATVSDEVCKAATANVRLIQQDFQLPWDGFSSGQMVAAIQKNPNALFIPRFHLGPPKLWLEEHPLPMVVNNKGEEQPYPSLASDEVMAAWKHQIDLLVHFLRREPMRDRIFGYHPGYLSGGEWFYEDVAHYYFDYSEANRSSFQAWAEKQYETLAALNTAWKRDFDSFDQIAIPSEAEWSTGDDGFFRDPAQQKMITDYQLYFNNLTADRINELGAYIKQLTEDRSLVATFYGYQFELLNNSVRQSIGSSGHLALQRVLDSPDVDLLCSPVSYEDRQPGGASNLMGPVDSITLAGKIQLQEDDSRTHLWISPPPEASLIYGTEENTLNCLRRNFGNILSHNLAMWWMDLQSNGNYNGQSIWDSNKKLVETYDETIAEALPVRPQVALIYDEDSAFWLKGDSMDMTGANKYLRTVFQALGAQVGYYNIEDVTRLPKSVRLIVFVNTFRLNAAEKASIKKVKEDGRTLLWMYAPGYVTEDGLSVEAMSQLTGFDLERIDEAQPGVVAIGEDNYPAITQGLDAKQLMGTGAELKPTFSVNSSDAEAIMLGRYLGSQQIGIALKDFGTWRSIFCGAPSITVPMARSIARYAGVVLQNDSQRLDRNDVVQSNDRFVYVYARRDAGKRAFQLTSELVPNGSFELDTRPLPDRGYGQWLGSAEGRMQARIVAQAGVSESNGLVLGPIEAASGSQSATGLLRLPQASAGATYQVEVKVKVRNLDCSGAGETDSIALEFRPMGDDTAQPLRLMLAEGKQAAAVSNDTWVTLKGTYTHPDGTKQPKDLGVYLAVEGSYSADAIILDDVSIRVAGTEPAARIVNILTGAELATHATGWVDEFEVNEQKIYRIVESSQTTALLRAAE